MNAVKLPTASADIQAAAAELAASAHDLDVAEENERAADILLNDARARHRRAGKALRELTDMLDPPPPKGVPA